MQCYLSSIISLFYVAMKIRESPLPSISSLVKNDDKPVNALQPNKLTAVAVLCAFGFVLMSAVLVGLFVIRRRRMPSDRRGTFPASTGGKFRLPTNMNCFKGESKHFDFCGCVVKSCILHVDAAQLHEEFHSEDALDEDALESEMSVCASSNASSSNSSQQTPSDRRLLVE